MENQLKPPYFTRDLEMEQKLLDELMDYYDFESIIISQKALREYHADEYDVDLTYKWTKKEDIPLIRQFLRKEIKDIFEKLNMSGGKHTYEALNIYGVYHKHVFYSYEVDGLFNIKAEYWEGEDEPYVLTVKYNLSQF